jgi:hypothetical protein
MENEGIELIGGTDTPDFFSDEAIMFDLAQGTVRITFATARNKTAVAGGPGALVATGRLIMPIPAAQRLSLGLHDYLVKHGFDPSAAVRGDETPQ